jgi:NTP pyrophosphatase (non-canonical NTP hydrolase)
MLSPDERDLVTCIDEWLDDKVGAQYKFGHLAQDWARVGKISEECGEAIQALIGITGQNPRKGVQGTMDDLLNELADCAWTAVLAIQHFTKDASETSNILTRKGLQIHVRMHKSER